jgi:uncharacterized membrane protein
MTYKTLKRVEGITCIVMLFILAAAFLWGLWYLPLIAIFCAAVMFGVLIYRMKEPYRDERTIAIDEKAGKATMSIASFGMLLAGSILLAINNDISTNIGQAAITIFSITIGLNLISYFTKLYYKNKLGGK